VSGYDGNHRTPDVEPGGSLEEIKRAYRGLAHIWHRNRPPSDNIRVESKPNKGLKGIKESHEPRFGWGTREPPRQSRPAAPPPPRRSSPVGSTLPADTSTTGHGGRSTRASKVGSWLAIGAVIAALVAIVAVGLWQPQPLTQPQPSTPASPTASAQSNVQTLPDGSIELQPDNAVISAHPYAIPKFDDPLYDPLKEADVKAHKAVRQYRRGVFVGYGEIRAAEPASTSAPSAATSVPEISKAAKTPFMRYTNPKYKFSAAVPSNVFVKNETPSSTDRALFVSADGRTKLLLLGKYNPRSRTLAKIYSEWATEHTATDPGKVVDYKVLRDGWFVVSGHDGPRGFYVKGVLREPTLLLMCLEYDEQDCPLTGEDISVMARAFDGK
jgi:hypothetical protein